LVVVVAGMQQEQPETVMLAALVAEQGLVLIAALLHQGALQLLDKDLLAAQLMRAHLVAAAVVEQELPRLT
jgi:hypothetical protein